MREIRADMELITNGRNYPRLHKLSKRGGFHANIALMVNGRNQFELPKLSGLGRFHANRSKGVKLARTPQARQGGFCHGLDRYNSLRSSVCIWGIDEEEKRKEGKEKGKRTSVIYIRSATSC